MRDESQWLNPVGVVAWLWSKVYCRPEHRTEAAPDRPETEPIAVFEEDAQCS